jgi:hypothetical protein
MSQKQRILDELRAHPEGVCLAMLPTDLSYTARNRIASLRREDFDIRGERCLRHAHRGLVYRYTLRESVVLLADRRPGNVPVARGGKKLRESPSVRSVGAVRSQTGELPVVGGQDRVLQMALLP